MMTDDEAHVRDMYLPFRERSWRPSCSLSKGAGRSEKVFCRASRWRPGVAHSGRTRPSTECRCTERHPGSTLSSSDTRMMDDEMMDDLRTVNRGAHKALTHRRARPARRSSGPCGAACERQGQFHAHSCHTIAHIFAHRNRTLVCLQQLPSLVAR